MRTRKNRLLFLTIVLVIAAGSIFGAWYPQKDKDRTQGSDLTRFPIVDFSASLPSDPDERAKRQANSKKYNGKYAPKIDESTDQIFYVSDWDAQLPALPVAKSIAIVIAEIDQARAFLSEDQTDVYSEFRVKVDEVLKNDNQNPISMGKTVVVERKGGRVRLPSGKIAVSLVTHQEMPRLSGRYVLFLTHNFPSGGQIEGYYLLTGYELRGGHVFALDSVSAGHPIAKYNGVEENAFITDLRNVVANAN